jgi:hypothetical protein
MTFYTVIKAVSGVTAAASSSLLEWPGNRVKCVVRKVVQFVGDEGRSAREEIQNTASLQLL